MKTARLLSPSAAHIIRQLIAKDCLYINKNVMSFPASFSPDVTSLESAGFVFQPVPGAYQLTFSGIEISGKI